MKKTILLLVAIVSVLIIAGCQRNEVQEANLCNQGLSSNIVFTAGFETVGTRTYVDSDLYMYWSADDRLSIFTSTYNEQYKFDGKTGDTGGSFTKVNPGQFVSGNPVSNNYGVYPFNSETRLNRDEKIELYLPQVQSYAENTFGVGANTMVAVTDGTSDTFLPFKNVCGYLVVKLYGEGKVKSVIFEGNNGEKISGGATVAASHDGTPIVSMSDTATTSIRIDCGEGVELGRTADQATAFWFVIPPTTFSLGFTVKAVGDDDKQMIKKTTSSRSIQRNVINELLPTEAQWDHYVEFDDYYFKSYCVENFDQDGNGEISYTEANQIERISFYDNDILSIKGIEHFSNLKTLRCCPNNGPSGFGIHTLDVSHNVLLDTLICSCSCITSLDISNNPHLKYLDCSSCTLLTALNIDKNASLQYLNCSLCDLAELNINNNTSLQYLNCSFTSLFNLDVSNNRLLSVLICGNELMSSLDISNNVYLDTLVSYIWNLESIDISSNTELRYLEVSDNCLSSLDVSHNKKLEYLGCSNNGLTSLDVSNNKKLEYLGCSNNRLTSLDVSNNTELRGLSCASTQISSLNISNNDKLKLFSFGGNLIKSIDLSNNASLTTLQCEDNQLTELDVSNNHDLIQLNCNNNQLTELMLNNNINLKQLRCRNNKLTELDLSNNKLLSVLWCEGNPELAVVWLSYDCWVYNNHFRYDSSITKINYK